MLDRFLFRKIDNSSLVLFRIFFGILVSLECYGAILTGWVKKTLIEPKFTFSFIGFEWLQPLPGSGMYLYFLLMGTLGICIALGFKYRMSIIAFTILWTGTYLMQKTSYNNHYYLLILISFIMIFLPANRSHSIDVKLHPKIQTDGMFTYVKWIIVAQLFIVYTYAAIAKLYGDWLDLSIIALLMESRAGYSIIGELLQKKEVHQIMAIFGILFDFLIIPALLWKPSRKIAFVAAIFFHLFNSIVFQIGIFPYLALAFTIFFFEGETIRNIFFKSKKPYAIEKTASVTLKTTFLVFWGIYFIVQLALPLRHYLIPDNVLWTEEGHRMSWRMMLRSRSGSIRFIVVNKETNKRTTIKLDEYLTKKQQRKVASFPDFIWQFAQHIKKEHTKKGEQVAVYVRSRAGVNGKPYKRLIDPTVDLGAVSWNYFGHNNWILPYKTEEKNTIIKAVH